MLEWYLDRASHRPRADTHTTRCRGRLPYALDPIPPELVGCANVKVLRAAAARAGMGRDITAALSYLGEDGVPPPTAESQGREPKEPPTVHVSQFAKKVMRELVRIRLLRQVQDRRLCETLRLHPECGIFGVEKAGKIVKVKGQAHQAARLVFDARPGNLRLGRIDVPLSLFTLHMFLEAVALFPGFYCVSKDMRHYYYQWKISEALQRNFVVRADDEMYLPQVLLMGYADACVMAQAATWALAMMPPDPSEVRTSTQGPDLGLPLSTRRSSSLPRMAWLREGGREDGRRIGALFVLLDGVFVMTEDQQLRDDWRRRIEENARRCNVIIKEGEDSNDVRPLEFGGVEMARRTPGRVTGIRPASRDRSWPQFNKQAGGYRRREVASAAGKTLWVCRVRQAEPAELGFIASVSAQVGAGEGDWDDICDPGKQCMSQLRALLIKYGDNEFRPPRSGPRQKTGVRLLATDATPTRWGWIEMRDGQVVAWGASEKSVVEKDQVLMEMQAVREAVHRLPNFDPTTEAVLIAIDADSVTHAIGKGYSGSEQIREELQKLRVSNAVIRARRVPGKDNLADLPSRGVDVHEALSPTSSLSAAIREDAELRRQETWRVLAALRDEYR